ncbi:myosin-9 [Helianthus annuus]|uniref:Paramyosin n=1 Tax=Helianthus annuus TaxID=4232 RepID=A0A251U2P5_HELAN|nr:myosin-9 [Helianthus annuus]XP_021976073.1 myosin-9 [Helianthus annuus]KAJ0551939.1 hypothetical protein HanHA89_Chr08g0279341 [Helianthus annuus]
MADGDDNDAVLSDVEEDDNPPAPIVTGPISSIRTRSSTDDVSNNISNNVSIERFRELLTELDRERQAREAIEKSKSELQVSFNRLKVLAHEAIKKRDEVVRSNEKLSVELAETVKEKEELMKQKEEVVKELEESVKAKEGVKSEIGTAAQMLVTGIDKISGKVNRFKNFTAGGLPRSQKYTGLPAVAYGVIKRTNEIVEELVRQIELVTKGRNEAREQMEQRSYEIAIEVSELEATISGLRDEVAKKTSVVERLENLNEEKDEMMGELETELKEKQDLVSEYGDKLRVLEERMDSQRPLLVDQLSHVSKIHDRICEVVKVIDGDKKADLSDSLFLPQETDLEENMRASLAGLETINELSSMALEKMKALVAERSREVKSLNETVNQLTREKEHIGSLLRSALSRRMSADPSLKTNELFKVAEKGLRESGVNYRFNNHTGHEKTVSSNKDGNVKLDDDDDDEISTLAGALEKIIKQSQIEIIELQHSVDELRAESSLLKERVEAQAKELLQSKQKLEELEEKERVANENVEGLMMDIAAAEEEITRWKVAAQQEAAAGKAVEQDYVAQLHTIRQELEEAKQSVIESEKKLKFKEETAAAAMSARDAAESSLKLADTRAARLRERVEELTSQLEELDTRSSLINGKRPRYICWPWQWLGLDPIGPRQLDTHEHTSNEMELSEPLL